MIPRTKLISAIVSPETTILETVKSIEAGGIQAAFITDKEGRLLGVTTDGDIRRGILRGVSLTEPVRLVMNVTPTVLGPTVSREEALAVMSKLSVRQIPVTDSVGNVLGCHHINELGEASDRQTSWVIVMAGGLGSRLYPLTQTTPKPMLPIGGRPLMEIIVRNLVAQGFNRIYLSVNYMADVFKTHFGNGSAYGADIRYIEETSKLGTAGALALIPERPPAPFLVMNGDLLTSVNFQNLITFHHESKGLCTICVRDYTHQIPYGVVQTKGTKVVGITEKPTKSYFVNAGIYVLDPSLLDQIRPGSHLDMPTLIQNNIEGDGAVNSFPIHEYWLDIGHFDDLQRARTDYDGAFKQ